MSEKMKILQMIENGEISPDEGIQMLSKLSEPAEQHKNTESSTMAILSKIDQGEITAVEGLEILKSSTPEKKFETDNEDSDESTESYEPPVIPDTEINRWKNWWKNLLYVGMAISALAAFWMATSYQNHGYNFWFFCSWLPLAIGILLVVLATKSQSSPWIHVRVKSDRENVAISLPAPIGITKWGLRNFGHHIPQFDGPAIDDMIIALENSTKHNAPIYIHVNEDDGEKVEVFIG